LRQDDPSAGSQQRVMAAFQESMQTFLEVQRATMLAYLAGKWQHSSHQHTAPATAARSQPGAEDAEPRALADGPNPAANGATAFASQLLDGAPPAASAHAPSDRIASAFAGRAEISQKLLDIVRERTGYPPEVLGLELDLEADLGIDSIKRVEILGKLRDAFPQLGGAADLEAMDRLVDAKTLGAIVDRVEQAIAHSSAATNGHSASSPHSAPFQHRGKTRGSLRRMLLEEVAAPLEGAECALMGGGTVLITMDDRGVTERLGALIRSSGWPTVTIGGASSGLDWSSPAAVEQAIERARRDRPFAGFVHLSPLRGAAVDITDKVAWNERLSSDVCALFLLAKVLGADLRRAAQEGGACVIAATSMGGRFASAGTPEFDFFPGQGAVSGLIKTIAREWTSVRTRVVDFSAACEAPRLAETILAELFHDDGWAEVGYHRGRRIRLRGAAAPLPGKPATGGLSLAPGEPVLITGGARGITSLVAAELARRWRPTLLLLGTTPIPGDSASPEIDLTDPADVKSALFLRLRREGRSVLPMDLERAYQAAQREQEVRDNLARLRACGAHVEYAQADVRDPASLAGALRAWKRRFGDPVGLIHGAGLIRDKLLQDKSLSSFDRVLETKLAGALNLARLLRPELLRFSVFFSSISGRFGNRGQADYAAANDALNKLAIWLDRCWPGRVVAPVWGPWKGIGMVSNLEGHLGAEGLGMISPEAGVEALIDELAHGRKGDVEVIFAAELGTLEEPIKPARRLAEAPR
jgi:NAD(P)-dependent dehydrogenase (short-subunit alcohol dehydrogenase family)/acyl carrier protein